MELRFSVPGEPRGKGRPRATTIGGHARMFTDSKTRSYEGLIALAAEAALSGRLPYDEPIEVHIRARFTPPASASKKARAGMLAGEIAHTKRVDLDNIFKAVADGCNAVIFRDDCLIVKFSAVKLYAEVAGIDVLVRPLRPTPKPDLRPKCGDRDDNGVCRRCGSGWDGICGQHQR